jgi:hypothetical protein
MSGVRNSSRNDPAIVYTGVASETIKPVFQTALRLRHRKPSTSDVISKTGTSLKPSIVSAIVQGALRLLPVDASAEGKAARKAEEEARALAALEAETALVELMRQVQPAMLDEVQQRDQHRLARESGAAPAPLGSTPDILFLEPMLAGGTPCCWIEYKNGFGFKKNPFVYGKMRKQCARYAATLGPGIVVFKLGYERDLLSGVEGVRCFREADLLSLIGQQTSDNAPVLQTEQPFRALAV